MLSSLSVHVAFSHDTADDVGLPLLFLAIEDT